MILVTGLVRVLDRGIWEAFEKAVCSGVATLDQELSHFQAFGLEVFIFTAKVAKFGWCG